jgi:hypothetical protein
LFIAVERSIAAAIEPVADDLTAGSRDRVAPP